MCQNIFLNNATHNGDGFIKAVAVSVQLPTTNQRIVLLDPALSEKVAAAEAKYRQIQLIA